jgi:metallophosphoesterase (TIGR00282 family)
VRLLFVGDVVGRPGRRILREALPELRARYAPDCVVVNGENAAGGAGITPAVAEEIAALDVDAITLGNHTWDHRELIPAIDGLPKLLRPANYPPGTPGRGSMVVRTKAGVAVGIISLMGRVFSAAQLDDPFRALDHELELVRAEGARVVLVDFHADATSEKQAFAWYADGRVTAVIGTHTHVQTADAAVLPGGTAYITDVGMTGPWLSVLGVDPQTVVEKFLTQMPVRFSVAKGPAMFNGALIDADEETGRARAIQALFWREPATAGVEAEAEPEERRR